MLLDSHVHVWDPSRSPYSWLRGSDAIDRTFTLEDLSPDLDACGIGDLVLVQSDDTAGDTDFMRELAAVDPRVRGIVGYAPLHEPQIAAATFARWREDPLMVGVRNLIHMRPEPDWMTRPAYVEGLKAAGAAGIAVDVIAVTEAHLEQLVALAGKLPDVTFVLDHLGQPPVTEPKDYWWPLMQRLGEHPRVFAKLSGMYIGGSVLSPVSVDQVRQVRDLALAAFGAERLMYGGDWPIAVLAGGYGPATAGIRAAIAELSAAEQDGIGRRAAETAYALPLRRQTGT
ncbi:amidohydrolase family protein [Microbacterium sediminicola]|uniref:Amidohydrolase family protein n=1 Tax=Microbacterium sediminicola TaxID=415210 RepID=A0ABN2IDF7_9MICO